MRKMEIKIVVDGGMVQNVFATDDCDVEIIDLDSAIDFCERDELEERVYEIRDSSKFKIVA